MYQLHKQFKGSPRAEENQDINTLNMEVEQLRRQNHFLRKRLQKLRSKDDSRRTLKSRTSIDDRQYEGPSVPSDQPMHSLLKELAVIRDTLKKVFPNVQILKNLKQVHWQQKEKKNEQILERGLQQNQKLPKEERYRHILQLFEEYYRSCRKSQTQLEETLEEAADYVRRIGLVLHQRLKHIKRYHDLTNHKVAILKLLHEQAKQQAGLMLRDTRRMMQRQMENFQRHWEQRTATGELKPL